jgi:hypothetical protein
MGLITLDEVIKSACSDFNDPEELKYEKTKDLIVRGYTELELFIVPSITTAILPISDNMTAKLPDDFIYHTKVGISSGKNIYVLGVNNDITSDESCGCSSKEEADSVISSGMEVQDRYTFHNVRLGGNSYGEKYGMAAGHNSYGYYKFDKQNHRVALGSCPFVKEDSKIYLEYKANSAIKGLAYVPSEAKETLVFWAGWKMFYGTSLGDRCKADYMIFYNKLKSLYLAGTYTEYEELFLKAFKSSPKR